MHLRTLKNLNLCNNVFTPLLFNNFTFFPFFFLLLGSRIIIFFPQKLGWILLFEGILLEKATGLCTAGSWIWSFYWNFPAIILTMLLLSKPVSIRYDGECSRQGGAQPGQQRKGASHSCAPCWKSHNNLIFSYWDLHFLWPVQSCWVPGLLWPNHKRHSLGICKTSNRRPCW